MDADYGLGLSRRASKVREAQKSHRVAVTLNDEQMAAVEGWRLAHGFDDQSEALGELVRLALLGEIAKIYRLVSENRLGNGREPHPGDD
jgi:hypothetical protein